jgi:hypothetical protein
MVSANLGLIDATPLGYSDTAPRWRSILFFYLIGELRMDANEVRQRAVIGCLPVQRRAASQGSLELKNAIRVFYDFRKQTEHHACNTWPKPE